MPRCCGPGRLSNRTVEIPLPKLRPNGTAILAIHGKRARRSQPRTWISTSYHGARPGFSGADLANLVNESRDQRRGARDRGVLSAADFEKQPGTGS